MEQQSTRFVAQVYGANSRIAPPKLAFGSPFGRKVGISFDNLALVCGRATRRRKGRPLQSDWRKAGPIESLRDWIGGSCRARDWPAPLEVEVEVEVEVEAELQGKQRLSSEAKLAEGESGRDWHCNLGFANREICASRVAQ